MRNLIREILKEDLKNWGVSDATKDKYKMSPLKEDIPVHMDISPVKKIWEKFRRSFPKTPEYVLRDFFEATYLKDKNNLKDLIENHNGDFTTHLGSYWFKFFNSDWKLEVLTVNPEDFDNNTVNTFLERGFGEINALDVPDDEARMELQKKLAGGKGMNEPVVVVRKEDGKYQLIEGWHRTMATLLLGDNDEDLKNWDKVKIRAFVATFK